MKQEFLSNGDDDEVQIVIYSTKEWMEDFHEVMKEEVRTKHGIDFKLDGQSLSKKHGDAKAKPTSNYEYTQERKKLMEETGHGERFNRGIKGKVTGDAQRKSC